MSPLIAFETCGLARPADISLKTLYACPRVSWQISTRSSVTTPAASQYSPQSFSPHPSSATSPLIAAQAHSRNGHKSICAATATSWAINRKSLDRTSPYCIAEGYRNHTNQAFHRRSRCRYLSRCTSQKRRPCLRDVLEANRREL